MGGLFSSPKSVKAPPVPKTEPLPEVIEGAEDEARKKARRRKGRKETFITGELVPEPMGKKALLG